MPKRETGIKNCGEETVKLRKTLSKDEVETEIIQETADKIEKLK